MIDPGKLKNLHLKILEPCTGHEGDCLQGPISAAVFWKIMQGQTFRDRTAPHPANIKWILRKDFGRIIIWLPHPEQDHTYWHCKYITDEEYRKNYDQAT